MTMTKMIEFKLMMSGQSCPLATFASAVPGRWVRKSMGAISGCIVLIVIVFVVIFFVVIVFVGVVFVVFWLSCPRQVGEERHGRHIWLGGNPVPLLGAALHPRLIVY